MATPDAEAKRNELELRKEKRRKVSNAIGLVVLTAALSWSVAHVGYYSFFAPGTTFGDDKTVVTFAHWQLEGTTVDTINKYCREYMELHPDVVVQQIEVPERGYEQWVKTRLIGNEAPDLIEIKPWKWQTLINRYFVPLATYIDEPNPYNEGTEHEGVAWRDTYRDNMMGGWIEELQAIYGIPMSLFTIRIYANKDLLEKASGSAEAPRTLGEFLAMCERIEKYSRDTQKDVIPIAGSDYIANIFRDRYWKMATWGLREKLDDDLNGTVSETERLEAILVGDFDMTEDPHIRAGHGVLYEISRHFQRGFMAAKREQAVFLFAQSNAAMIATGSWEAGTLWEQVKGDFEITVFDFPTAAPDNPRYGDYIRYRVSEADARSGFGMGLTKASRNKEAAIDFMHFMTSKRINERMNQDLRWFPAIKGAKPDRILKAFEPQVEGVYEVYKMEVGNDTRLAYLNGYASYMSKTDPSPQEYQRVMQRLESDVDGYRSFAEEQAKGNTESARNYLPRKVLQVLEDELDGDPSKLTYTRYVQMWRDENYRQFIEDYSRTFHQKGLADMQRAHKTNYNSIANNEGAIAQIRARAMRMGMDDTNGRPMQGDVERNLKTLLFKQSKRVSDWAQTGEKLDKIAKATGKEASE